MASTGELHGGAHQRISAFADCASYAAGCRYVRWNRHRRCGRWRLRFPVRRQSGRDGLAWNRRARPGTWTKFAA